MKFLKSIAIGVLAMSSLFLSGCGQQVEVPPASVGKIITKSGYQEGLIGTSKFRLDPCWAYCDKLAVLQLAERSKSEQLEIFMPKDKLILTTTVQATLAINQNKSSDLFDRIVPQESDKPDTVNIPWENVYRTYAQQIILITTREYLSQFSISEVSSNMESINSNLRALIQKELTEKTPFTVRNVGITNITYPPVITDAQLKAAERREDLQREEALLKNSQVRLQRELQEAQLTRQIELEKAKTEAASQKIQREVVDDKVLALRAIETQQMWINKWNGQLPTTNMGGDTNAMMMIGK